MSESESTAAEFRRQVSARWKLDDAWKEEIGGRLDANSERMGLFEEKLDANSDATREGLDILRDMRGFSRTCRRIGTAMKKSLVWLVAIGGLLATLWGYLHGGHGPKP